MDTLALATLPPNPKNGTMASYGDDSAIMAMFDDEYVANEYRSEQEGKTVYDHFIRVSLEYPGNNTTTFQYRFKPADGLRGNQWTQRFANQWQAFQAQKEQVPEGTPIEMWPPLDKRRVLELKSLRIHTVEQISAMTDQNGPNIGLDWRKIRDMAHAYLNPAISQVTISKLNHENDELKNRIQSLENQISSIASNSASVPLEAPKRRGRPPRQETTAA